MSVVRVGLEDFRRFLTELLEMGEPVELTSYGRVVALVTPVQDGERVPVRRRNRKPKLRSTPMPEGNVMPRFERGVDDAC